MSSSDAIKRASRIADLSPMRVRLRVTGDDRVAFLHGQCTNDIKRLVAGQSCYTAFLNPKGKMRGEGYIICLNDEFLLEVNSELPASLEKFIITEDVAIEDVSGSLGEWLVIAEGDFDLPAGAHRFAHPLGIGVLSPVTLPASLDPETLEALRVEAGVPKWNVDMDENTIPNEAGLEARAISYEKGCYIGQETIARIKTYGHVNRRLVQVVGGGQRSDKIVADEREVGQVTSAAYSAKLGKPVVLGYVRREFARVGTTLKINNITVEVTRICGE